MDAGKGRDFRQQGTSRGAAKPRKLKDPDISLNGAMAGAADPTLFLPPPGGDWMKLYYDMLVGLLQARLITTMAAVYIVCKDQAWCVGGGPDDNRPDQRTCRRHPLEVGELRCSQLDIADRLGISEGSVRMALHRLVQHDPPLLERLHPGRGRYRVLNVAQVIVADDEQSK